VNVIPLPHGPNLRLVLRAPAPRRRLSVRINVLDGRAPYGRSTPFRITEDDLRDLVEVAMRMERRA
jgi:hypothetical protein